MHERMLTGYILGPRRYLSLLDFIQIRSTEGRISKRCHNHSLDVPTVTVSILLEM